MILEEGEVKIAEIRKHWYVFVRRLYLTVFLAVLPWLIIWGVNVSLLEMPISATPVSVWLGIFLYTLWLMVLWTGVFLRWTDHYLDIWVVTPERIIDIDQNGLFKREVSSIRFERVQDITTEVNGLIATFLGYGDLHVQSAGDRREILMRGAQQPSENKRFLLEQLNKVMETPEQVRIAREHTKQEGAGSNQDGASDEAHFRRDAT